MALCCARIGFGPTSPSIEQRNSTVSSGAALWTDPPSFGQPVSHAS